MFENVGSLCVSKGGRAIGSPLEALEDRITPVVIGPGINGVALDPFAVAVSAPIDQAFLAESARLSFVQASLATTAASQGSNPQVRQLAALIADEQTTVFNATVPFLGVGGFPFRLTPLDTILLQTFGSQPATTIDSQFLALSTLFGLQSATLAQTELFFGVSPTVRSFAQAGLFVTQQELQFGAALLGPSSTLSITGLFGSFNAINPTLVITNTGFGTTAVGTSTGFGPASTVGSGPGAAFGAFGFGTSNGFGPGATFGTSNGFGPSSSVGFGPNVAFGAFGFGTSTGFGPGSF